MWPRTCAIAACALLALVLARAEARGAAAAPSWPQLWARRTEIPTKAAVRLVLADLDGDGADDPLVVSGARGTSWRVLALDGRTGRALWEWTRGRRVEVALADLDDRAGEEVLAAAGDTLWVLRGADGVVASAVRLRAPVGEIAVARLDGRAGPDVVYTAGEEYDDVLVALSGGTWQELWARRTDVERAPLGGGFGALAVADLDGGARDEILVTERRNSLLCLDSAGSARWSATLGQKSRYLPEGVASCAPLAAVFSGQGPADVAIGCFAGALVLLDGARGEELLRLQFGLDAHARHASDARIPGFVRDALARTGEPISELSPVDLDGQPGAELVFGSSDGSVYAVAPLTGETLWRFESESDVYDRCLAVPRAGAPLVVAWDVEATYVLDGASGKLMGRLALPGGASAVGRGDVNADGLLDVVAIPFGERTVRAWSTGVAVAR